MRLWDKSKCCKTRRLDISFGTDLIEFLESTKCLMPFMWVHKADGNSVSLLRAARKFLTFMTGGTPSFEFEEFKKLVARVLLPEPDEAVRDLRDNTGLNRASSVTGSSLVLAMRELRSPVLR